MAEADPTDLRDAAIELNDTLGLEPAIDPREGEDEIVAALHEAALDILPDDDISESTMATLRQIGAASQPEPEGQDDGGDEEEADDTDDDDEDTEPDPTVSLEGEEDELKAVHGDDSAAFVQKTASNQKAAIDPNYKRADALVDALKEGGTRDEIVNKVEAYYRYHRGGEPDMKAATDQCNIHLPVLRRFGVVEKNGSYWYMLDLVQAGDED